MKKRIVCLMLALCLCLASPCAPRRLGKRKQLSGKVTVYMPSPAGSPTK